MDSLASPRLEICIKSSDKFDKCPIVYLTGVLSKKIFPIIVYMEFYKCIIKLKMDTRVAPPEICIPQDAR